MDLFDGLVGALRRWYVLFPILVITALLAVVVHGRKTTEYQSVTVVGVTTNSIVTQSPVPSGSPTINRGNALVSNGGVTLVANLMSLALQQQAVQRAVIAAGGTTSYTIDLEQRGPANSQLPIMDINVTGVSAQQVSATMTALRAAFTPTLERIQQSAGVPTQNYARFFVLQPATPPSRAVLSTARNTGVVIVVGVVVALVLAAVVDNLVARRGRRRRPRPRPRALRERKTPTQS